MNDKPIEQIGNPRYDIICARYETMRLALKVIAHGDVGDMRTARMVASRTLGQVPELFQPESPTVRGPINYHKCAIDGCETTMSEGAPPVCPTHQQQGGV